MASAIFCVPVENSNPILPPLNDNGSIYLSHANGHGYSCIGLVPSTSTCLVRVYSNQATIDAMADDANYLFVEQVN